MTTVMDKMLKDHGLAPIADDGGEDCDIANGDSFVISIEVDDILGAFGSTLIAMDIFKQIGDLSTIYSRIVHPVIAELYNGIEDLRHLDNIYKDNEIADYIHDSLESKIYLMVDSLRDHARITVETKEISKLCVTLVEMLITHIRELVSGKEQNLPKKMDVLSSINILERARTELLPNPRDPLLLNIVLEYYWVYY